MIRSPLALAALAAALAACDARSTEVDSTTTALAFGPSSSGATIGVASSWQPQVHRAILDDDHAGGVAGSMILAETRFGRSVELWSEAPDGHKVLVAPDFVIGPDYVGDGQSVRLVLQPVLGTERLVVMADATDTVFGGRRRFLSLAATASATTIPMSDAGVDGSGRLTEVARNAALELRFSDLIDVAALSSGAVRVLVGEPSVAPFEARIIEDALHGGVSTATGQFAPTRVILDLAPRMNEAQRSRVAVSAQPAGLPAALTDAANVVLRISTAGGPTLSNLSGAPLAPGTGSVDLGSASQDIVRPFRSGSNGGAYGGFLPDGAGPRLVARADVQIVDAPVLDPMTVDVFTLPRVQFASFGCAGPPQVGDIVRQTDLVAEVLAAGSPATAGQITNVRVQLLTFPVGWTGPSQWITDGIGPARYDAPYDLSMDTLRVACLVEVDPDPLGAPSAPTRGLDPMSSFTLAFNEPLAAASLDNLEASMLGRTPLAATGSLVPVDIVVSTLVLGADGESIRLSPVVPLSNPQGLPVTFWLTPRLGINGASDLTGNPLQESPGPIGMSLDPSFPGTDTGSLLWRFDGPDEGAPVGPEWSGQFSFDLVEERIRPRPVSRFQAVVDRSQPLIAAMTAFPIGTQTPLNPLGARLQTLWRYADMGFSLADPATANIDVEGLSWSPAGGMVSPEVFGEFEIALGHSVWAPDEVIDPSSLFPRFQNSGLRSGYDDNVLLLGGATKEVVHPRALGYAVNPGDLTLSQNGTPLMPFPLNRDASQPTRTYTWRDTEIRSRAGAGSGGVEPQSYLNVLGIPVPGVSYYRAGNVQTLGLPLLMDFSTWPDSGAGASNAFDVSLAVNSSSRPYFRAFTAGGVNQSGSTVFVDPSQETVANGGFNPGSNPPGAATFGRDNSVYLGAADFVVRKSVAHSVWVDAGFNSGNRTFVDPIVAPATQPAGASLRVDLRVASEVQLLSSPSNVFNNNDNDLNGIVDFLEDADQLDLYGDYYSDGLGLVNHDAANSNPGVTFAGAGDDDWRSSAAGITGARFMQVRLVMESDIATGARPSVSAVGLAWQN